MIFKIAIQPNQITEPTTLVLNDNKFPILNIDVDSYIVGASVETGLNFHMEDGCYSLQIGKYCSMAEDILFMIDINHDYKSVFQGCISVLKDTSTKSRLRRKGEILILNDVWIGHGVTIMDGVLIGNGAVVAAQSVVTKSVPDYAIVAGNPAKIVGWRFDEIQRTKMSKIGWWNWDSQKISKATSYMTGDIDQFVDKYENEIVVQDDQMKKYENPILDADHGKNYVFVADYDIDFPLITHVIKEFCETYPGGEAKLVLYIFENAETVFEKIMGELEKYEDTDCRIQIIDGKHVDIKAVLYYTDVYITNRAKNNIKLVDFARRYGKEIVSGCSYPILF